MRTPSRPIDHILQRLREDWSKQGVPLNPPATHEDLRRLECILGVSLPSDVIAFYSTWNGMVDYESVGEALVSFWSIDRICREADIAPGGDAGDEFLAVAFADVLIYAWCFRFGVRSGGRLSVILDGHPNEFSSLTSFLETYVASPRQLSL